MKFGKWMIAVATALSLAMGVWAQEKTEKKAKKKATEAVEEKKAEAGEKKTAAKKKAAEAVEEKKAAAAPEKKAAAAEKKAEVAEKKAAATEKKTAAAAKPGAPYTGGVVNLNTATKTQLMALPGVGEANADHIIKGRPYKSVDELITRKIVQQRYYDDFKQHVTTK